MLKLENITFSYDNETEALKNVTLNIEKGKKTLFLGENGSGKSTLFLIMNGLLKAQKGDIYFEGKKVKYKKKDLEELRRKVGIIFQDPEIQIFAPLVFQEVAYGPENLGYSEEKVEENVNRAMKEINIEDLKDRPCHHLSYGQKKRVSIAAITAMEPELLILDEPTAWLDSKNTKRVSEILEEVPAIVNKKDCIKFENFARDITFENVDFKYKDSNEKILKNINLDVKKGETIAFVGNSGGGKSTLVNLIPRFFDVSGGSLKIDGIDIRDYEIKSLRKAIGIVPQETFLFSGTILSNIKYSRQNATFEEIVEAAKQANAHEFIENLSDGYNTEIGERGVKLSGGQKQRIAIARAILENPQILILDEATSALDNESEKLVQDALEKLMDGKTTFVIAHRLTTIENSNKIVVIQKGEIKEVGNHNELLNKNGIYKALYNKNFDFNSKS